MKNENKMKKIIHWSLSYNVPYLVEQIKTIDGFLNKSLLILCLLFLGEEIYVTVFLLIYYNVTIYFFYSISQEINIFTLKWNFPNLSAFLSV